VAELYVAAEKQTKSDPLREDYGALADAYRRRAAAVETRARATGLSPATADRATLLEESSRFLERLAEVAAAVPVGEADGQLLAARLRRHAGLCDALAEELARAVRATLSGSEDADVRQQVICKLGGSVALQQRDPGSVGPSVSRPRRPATTPVRVRFSLAHIRPTGDWAALAAGPAELSVGDNLTCERPGVGPVGTLRVVSYSRDADLFVVHAVGETRFVAGDTARR
jgi:hypothetical protein